MPTPFPEYEQYDALGLAELIRKADISSMELLEAAKHRIEALNPSINAVNLRFFDQARTGLEARPVNTTNPFAGVPFLIKDMLLHVKGWPLTQGVSALKQFTSNEDSYYVSKCRRAGLVFLGRTNLPEFGLKGHTDNKFFGATKNPWNLNRTPGGSSGGSAAAVAAGMVPMASASDGGGSIRIPASYCGLFGLRPSRGRVSCGPHHAENWNGMVSDQVLTRSVRDSAAMLDILAGPMPGDPYFFAKPELPYSEAIKQSPKPLTIAYSLDSPIGTPVDEEAKRAVTETLVMLENLGHRVEQAQPDVDGEVLAKCYLMVYFGHVAALYSNLVKQVGKKQAEKYTELDTRVLAMLGETVSAKDYVSSHFLWNDFARAMGDFHQRYDLYLTPTTAQKPALIGSQDMPFLEQLGSKFITRFRLGNLLLASGMVEKQTRENLAKVPFTQLANFTGQPAMSVPLYFSQTEQLPYGVQFMAPLGDETTLLQLAAQLEQAYPWDHRRPQLKTTPQTIR